MLDLDEFKPINDRYGHDTGDRILTKVAAALRRSARGQDVVARFGGEEFIVVLRDAPFADGVAWCEQVRADVEALRTVVDDTIVPVTVSIGIACQPSREIDGNTIIKADRALYLGKRWGRNRVCSWRLAKAVHRLSQSEVDEASPPEARIGTLLSVVGKQLGPTHREHLTEHSRRVSDVACRLGDVLDVDARALDRLRVAGLFHDIGKIAIPETLLAKPSALRHNESRLMQRHADEGGRIARLLGVDDETAHFIQHHHTRFSPAGFRNDRPGETVPLGARVLCVADAYATMTSNRPYQSAKTPARAVTELERHAGTQFDPAVVRAARRAFGPK